MTVFMRQLLVIVSKSSPASKKDIPLLDLAASLKATASSFILSGTHITKVPSFQNLCRSSIPNQEKYLPIFIWRDYLPMGSNKVVPSPVCERLLGRCTRPNLWNNPIHCLNQRHIANRTRRCQIGLVDWYNALNSNVRGTTQIHLRLLKNDASEPIELSSQGCYRQSRCSFTSFAINSAKQTVCCIY